jgi:hypothetical protein
MCTRIEFVNLTVKRDFINMFKIIKFLSLCSLGAWLLQSHREILSRCLEDFGDSLSGWLCAISLIVILACSLDIAFSLVLALADRLCAVFYRFFPSLTRSIVRPLIRYPSIRQKIERRIDEWLIQNSVNFIKLPASSLQMEESTVAQMRYHFKMEFLYNKFNNQSFVDWLLLEVALLTWIEPVDSVSGT